MPKILQLKVKTESPALLSSGEGWGAIIDTDIVFDKYGLPYFPARRLKGLLKESALEVLEMTEGFASCLPADVETVFGRPGSKEGAAVRFYDLRLENYAESIPWLEWACGPSSLLSRDMVVEVFTDIRSQTAIDSKGLAEDNFLRAVRTMNAGYTFEGAILLEQECQAVKDLLALACVNLRRVGSKRNRGLGEVSCSLWDGQQELGQIALNKLKEGLSRA